MLAFEVEIDGKPLARAGVEDWSVLTLIVSASRGGRGPNPPGKNDLRLHLGALTLTDDEGVSHHVRWGDPEIMLTIGSQVMVRVIDTETVDPPRHRHRSDREGEDPPFSEEEIRELRYQDYLELKKEFEPDQAR